METSTISDEFRFAPAPAYHPELEFGYQNELIEVERVATLLGLKLMPWQRKAVAVSTQFKLDHRARRVYRYATVLITVPRQSGKTTLMGPLMIHRMMTRGEAAAIWYTAQSGQDARKRIMEMIELVEDSDMKIVLQSQRSNGAEGLKLKDKPGCHITRFSPTMSALHGEHPHLVGMDEIWHFDKTLGEALLGAAEPAQVTMGRRAQVWLISTMGTLESEFMNDLVEKGRTNADPAMCYIEYSMPDGMDAFDPDTWWSFHPALGNTIPIESLEDRAVKARQSPAKMATWLRAYCNKLGGSRNAIMDMSIWDELQTPFTPPADRSKMVVGFEVAPDNGSAAVVASWLGKDDKPNIAVVHQAPGTAWLVPHLEELAESWKCSFVADGAGPVQRFTDTFEENHTARRLAMSEYGQACESFLNFAAVEKTLQVAEVDGSDDLRAQLSVVEVQTSNGVRRFSRDKSPRAIPALIAAAVALYGLQHPEKKKSPPPLAIPTRKGPL